LLRLALPLVLGLSAAELISLTDTVLLASLGTVVLACVALTSSRADFPCGALRHARHPQRARRPCLRRR
jgi:Na+-driven multidrug efflux pump